jgi:hypothetical protein
MKEGEKDDTGYSPEDSASGCHFHMSSPYIKE